MTPPLTKLLPVPTPETQPYWDAARDGELRLQRCQECATVRAYPQSSCATCGSQKYDWFAASGRATLYSYVISHRPAPGFTPPFVIALVQLEEGPRMLSNVVDVPPDPEHLPLDLPLTVRFEDRGTIVVPVFAPSGKGDAA
ncbi:Zn-ribbon domain-containing OB-fold protein [Branchiibius cervicis]|uniref:Zn-ribbon domain-containing OB-fold protein n=1 Tax=Branchiibius cervicis TaxID=908252 RepID=A0ABW2AWE3_9MICO